MYSDTSLEYLHSIEIQTIMNLLKVIDNPTVDIPLVSVLRSMIGGFTDNELIQIRLTDAKKSFYETMNAYSKEDALKEKIQLFLAKIKAWKQEAAYLELDEFIWKLYTDTGYYHYVSLMPDGILRQANLKLLFEKAKQYEKVSFKGLYHFIHFIDKVKMNSGDLSSAKLIGENENVVRIMSIHKSKGLEFPVVFLCNSNKKFNIQDLNNPILLHQDLGLGANYIESKTKLQYPTLAKEAIKRKIKEEILSEEMRILYVALTRAKEKLIITGVTPDLKKAFVEKKELLAVYPKEEKINTNLLKKYTSYLDWIELVYLKNDQTKCFQFTAISKKEILDKEGTSAEETSLHPFEKLEEQIKKTPLKQIDEIRKKLNWEYPAIALSKIEAKSSISKIKQKANHEKQEASTLMNVPMFLQEENQKLTGAQKGTLIHLCMQNLSLQEEYTKEKLEELIQELFVQKKITQLEAENIDVLKLLHFTQSQLWQEVKKAKRVEREKPFYMSLPVKEVEGKEVEGEVLVQGVIDLFYINQQDEIVLVDYKTDYVTAKEELIQKYSQQLALYKRALEAAFNQKVSKTYLYSTCLEEEILL